MPLIRMSFVTSFDPKQPKVEPKLVSVLMHVRLQEFYAAPGRICLEELLCASGCLSTRSFVYAALVRWSL